MTAGIFTDPTDESTVEVRTLKDWESGDSELNENGLYVSASSREDEEDQETVTVYLRDVDRVPFALAALGEPGDLSDAGWLADTAALRDSDRHTDDTLLELARRSLIALAERREAAAAKNLVEIERKARIKGIEDAIGQRPLNLAAPLAPQLADRGIVAA